MKKYLTVTLLAVLAFSLYACQSIDTTMVVNPYEDVDWEADEEVLANLHTHTDADAGHGDDYPDEAVDLYHEHGYRALALTDHDLVTYNEWRFSEIDTRYEDRAPDELGMLDIPGNEYSQQHHFNGLFTTYCTQNVTYDSEREAMDNILAEDEDAIMFFAHPGRYWDSTEDYSPEDEYSPEWYLEFFDDYAQDELLGIEVFNRRNAYPYDRHLWDALLAEAMPERPIWAFANDDYHGSTALRSYTYHMLESFTHDDFRTSMIEGRFYASYSSPEAVDSPTIESIIVDEEEKTIDISVAGDYDEVRWISGTETTEYDDDMMDESFTRDYGRVVGTGATFDYDGFEGDYVRAEIVRDEGRSNEAFTLTQPFGFEHE